MGRTKDQISLAKLTRQNIPFTQIANEIINDPKLSLRAKGLFAYLFSKPEDWDFSAVRISNDSTENRKTVLASLKELEDSGYLSRKKLATGRVDYHLKYSQEPESEKGTLGTEPKSEIGTVANRHGGESAPISNKEIKVIKKDTNTSGVPPQDVAEVIDSFKAVNPVAGNWFGNTTQRRAAEQLIEIIGTKEKVIGFVQNGLKKINATKYAPTSTTPLQLLNNLAKIKAFVDQGESKKVGIII